MTGAADPTASVKDTLKGKLPQKKLVREAAHGYSSYGNQIGLATGYVKEIYHPDYVAKRMEIGAVMGAAPRSAVIRENSDPGDIIILLGGRTGRDGIGGATGSSCLLYTSFYPLCMSARRVIGIMAIKKWNGCSRSCFTGKEDLN